MIGKNWENNVTIAPNVLYTKKKKRYPANVSKHNSNHEKQVIHLALSVLRRFCLWKIFHFLINSP